MRINGTKAAKALLALLCLAVCCLCVGDRLRTWAAASGKEALLYAAGLGTTAAPEIAPSPASEDLLSQEGSPQAVQLPVDDGIVPFHDQELPPLSATPDPARASAPVEELLLDGGTQIHNFFVKDTSSAELDLAEELEIDPDISLKCNGEIEVLLYHTHTSEAYSDAFTGFYYTDMETRTGNQEKSVVAVGVQLKKALEARGIGVVHDTTVNDTLFNGSYSRSWEVLQKNLEEHPTIQVTIDIHRDSMTTQEGTKYKPTALIGGRKAAQCMILTGCDAAEDWGDFPDWQENLHFALRLQQKITSLYPGLLRPLDFSDSKYNMNATTGSLLIEVGTEVNTASEAAYSGRLLGEALADLLTASPSP